MKQFRISHLLLLIVICGLILGLVLQARRAGQFETALRIELEMQRRRGGIREVLASQREQVLEKKLETLEAIHRALVMQTASKP